MFAQFIIQFIISMILLYIIFITVKSFFFTDEEETASTKIQAELDRLNSYREHLKEMKQEFHIKEEVSRVEKHIKEYEDKLKELENEN